MAKRGGIRTEAKGGLPYSLNAAYSPCGRGRPRLIVSFISRSGCRGILANANGRCAVRRRWPPHGRLTISRNLCKTKNSIAK